MRRALVLAAIAIPLLLAIALVGFVLAARIGPERARAAAEQGLSEALAVPVKVTSARVSLRAGLTLVAEGVSAWQGPQGPAFEVARAEAQVDPIALLRGQLRPLRIALDGARLRLERTASDELRPDVFARLRRGAQRESAAHGDPTASLVGRLRGGLRAAAELALPSRVLTLRGAHVLFLDDRTAKQDAPAVSFTFQDVNAELREGGLGGALTLRASGSLVGAAGPAGSIALEGRRVADGGLDLELSLASLDLRAFEAYARAWQPRLSLAGLVDGRVGVTAGAGMHEHVDVEGTISHLDVALPRGASQPPLVIQESALRTDAAIELDPQALRLVRARILARSLALELDGLLERPIRGRSRAEIGLRVDTLSLPQIVELSRWLPKDPRREVGSVLQHVEAGEVAELEVRQAGTIARLREQLAGSAPLESDELELTATLRGARVRTGGEDALEDVFGHARWHGDTLELTGLRGMLRGEPLPQLDFTLTGVRRLLAADPARRRAPARVAPLAGRHPLAQILSPEGEQDPDQHRWTRLQLDADWIRHPVFLWPLEAVRALATPTRGGVHVEIERGLWGGAPVRGDADWTRAPLERFRVALSAEAPAKGAALPPLAAAPPPLWARGRFELELAPSPSGALRVVRGGVRAGGSMLALEALEAPLERAAAAPASTAEDGGPRAARAPRRRLYGDVRLDLSSRDAVGCTANLELEDADVDALAEALLVPAGAITGTLAVSTALTGSLRPGAPLLSGLDGQFLVHAVDGEVHRKLPFLFAISSVSDALRLFPSRDAIRYDSIEGDLRLEAGMLRSESLAIRSPDVRLVASGQVDVVRAPHELEAVVGVFFLRPLDTVIGSVPIVSQILLGPDKSLFGAYFSLTGPWSDPKASMVPMKSFASGPASFVLEGVPAFVRGGIRAIEAMLGPGAPPPGAEAAPEPRSGS